MQKYQRTGTLVLIWAVPSDPTAQIRSARGAAAEGRRRPSSAAALRGGSPDLAKLGCPGVKLTRFWVWGDLRGTCSPPGAFAGLEEVRSGASKGGGGSTRWRITSARVRVVLGLAQGCKACARALCSTGEPVRDSCAVAEGPPRRVHGAAATLRRRAGVRVPGVLYQP